MHFHGRSARRMFAAVVLFVAASGPALFVRAEEPKPTPEPTAAQVEQLQKQLKDMQKSLEAMEAELRAAEARGSNVTGMREHMAKIQGSWQHMCDDWCD